MRILMLTGANSCGKSTTLNKVYDQINPQKDDIIEPKQELGDKMQKDFKCIIRYKNKKIAFFTMGDYSTELCGAFVNYEESCDILICACNKKFKRPFLNIAKYPHTIVEKTMPLCNKSNEVDMKQLLRFIVD